MQSEHVTVSCCTPQDIRWVEIGKQQQKRLNYVVRSLFIYFIVQSMTFILWSS